MAMRPPAVFARKRPPLRVRRAGSRRGPLHCPQRTAQQTLPIAPAVFWISPPRRSARLSGAKPAVRLSARQVCNPPEKGAVAFPEKFCRPRASARGDITTTLRPRSGQAFAAGTALCSPAKSPHYPPGLSPVSARELSSLLFKTKAAGDRLFCPCALRSDAAGPSPFRPFSCPGAAVGLRFRRIKKYFSSVRPNSFRPSAAAGQLRKKDRRASARRSFFRFFFQRGGPPRHLIRPRAAGAAPMQCSPGWRPCRAWPGSPPVWWSPANPLRSKNPSAKRSPPPSAPPGLFPVPAAG